MRSSSSALVRLINIHAVALAALI